MTVTLTTPKGVYEMPPSALLELAKLMVSEAEKEGMEVSPTLKRVQTDCPGKTRLAVQEVMAYLQTSRNALMGDKRFRAKLIKPGKKAMYISLANLADYIDGR